MVGNKVKNFVSIEKGILPAPSHPGVSLRIISLSTERDHSNIDVLNNQIPTILIHFRDSLPIIKHNLNAEVNMLKAGQLGFWLETPKLCEVQNPSYEAILFNEKPWNQTPDIRSLEKIKTSFLNLSSYGLSSGRYIDGPLLHFNKKGEVLNFLPEGGASRIIFKNDNPSQKGLPTGQLRDFYSNKTLLYKRCLAPLIKTLCPPTETICVELQHQNLLEAITISGLVTLFGSERCFAVCQHNLLPEMRVFLKHLGVAQKKEADRSSTTFDLNKIKTILTREDQRLIAEALNENQNLFPKSLIESS